MIVLKRLRSAAKSMTEEMFDAMVYGTSDCPRCIVGHVLPLDRRRGMASIYVWERLCPTGLGDFTVLGRKPTYPVSFVAVDERYSGARRLLAHAIRKCRLLQRRQRMAMVKDLFRGDTRRPIAHTRYSRRVRERVA